MGGLHAESDETLPNGSHDPVKRRNLTLVSICPQVLTLMVNRRGMNNKAGAGSLITERQRQVLERLDRRLPIKMIANDLGVSQSRINQHISALKARSGANDLSELVAQYREGKFGPLSPLLRKDACTKSQLSEPVEDTPSVSRAANSELALADVEAFTLEAPWGRTRELKVVPGVLDGDRVVVRRLGVMLGMAVAIVSAILLTVAAATTLGRLLDGMADIPVDQTQAAD
jgi:hypothetical protein